MLKGTSIGQKPLLLHPHAVFCLIQELVQVEYGGHWGQHLGPLCCLAHLQDTTSLLGSLLALSSATISFPSQGKELGDHGKSTSSTSCGLNSSNHASTCLGSAVALLQADTCITIMSESRHSAWSWEMALHLP